MNILLFRQTELDPRGLLTVNDERAEHLLSVRKVKPGEELLVGELGGPSGKGRVVKVEGDQVEIELLQLETVEQPPPTDLFVAIPRPQILKKVLQYSAMIGVRSINLVRAARTEKSYLQSPLLNDSAIERQLLLGLEQGVSTYLPLVSIYQSFSDFAHVYLTRNEKPLPHEIKIIAQPNSPMHLANGLKADALGERTPLSLAIGPEGGWQDQEIKAFKEWGFQEFNIGHRILRVEVAISFLLGQLDLLRRIE